MTWKSWSGTPDNVLREGKMVYTVTLNPALDRNIWIEKIRYNDSNRIQKEERYAAGKGIDVSRVLTVFGIRNKALGFVGGFDGEEMEGRLLNEGISCDFTKISGETRTNIVIYDTGKESQTIFSASGPIIMPYELMRIIRQVEKLENPEFVIISGSLPPGVNPEIYYKIMEIARSKGSKIVLDTDGDALQTGIQIAPDLIKPNIHELSRLAGTELKDIQQVINTAKAICDGGTGRVLVSMGARGILLVGKKERYLAVPPPVKVVNTIGAGDSAVAGFIFGLLTGKTMQEALVCGVAAGTATTLRPGPALCTKDDFLELIPQVRLFQEKDISRVIGKF
jgi:6-phosphofructokinase 2